MEQLQLLLQNVNTVLPETMEEVLHFAMLTRGLFLLAMVGIALTEWAYLKKYKEWLADKNSEDRFIIALITIGANLVLATLLIIGLYEMTYMTLAPKAWLLEHLLGNM